MLFIFVYPASYFMFLITRIITLKPVHRYKEKYLYEFGVTECRMWALQLDLLQFSALPFPSCDLKQDV